MREKDVFYFMRNMYHQPYKLRRVSWSRTVWSSDGTKGRELEHHNGTTSTYHSHTYFQAKHESTNIPQYTNTT